MIPGRTAGGGPGQRIGPQFWPSVLGVRRGRGAGSGPKKDPNNKSAYAENTGITAWERGQVPLKN